MEIEKILKSRRCSFFYRSMLATTEPFAAYPGKSPAPRVGIRRRLQSIDDQTAYRLDKLVDQLRCAPFPEDLDAQELYMLRQRLLFAFEFLHRLSDSAPDYGWICAATDELEQEDRWLLNGLWLQFGSGWLDELSARIAKGLPE